ncbi:MAG TPA: FAD-binding oxidoreductase, partial [Candidatus Limnocylindria bacterium]|nr:FAD-binding oxidoreductase [Candidatus Limnocylindria bacterium]
MSSPDVAVIGGGIIGTAAAALLAEAGASVVLFEATAIGAGASGRNSGVIQHPYDRALAQLHTDSLASYRALDAVADGFALPSAPAGILLVTTDDGVIAETTERLAKATPELEPQAIAIGQAGLIEPELAADVGGCLLRTGYPVVPAAATDAFARRARRAGVSMRIGESAAPVIDDHRAVGVSAGESEILPAGQVLVAAGPWTPALVPGWQAQPPIGRSWGVVVSTVLPRPLRWVLEEETIDERGSAEPYASSLVTAAVLASQARVRAST